METIFRCVELGDARSRVDHHCRRVASAQAYSCPGFDDFQVPEPWRGQIETAPLLFVSSNPSLDPTDDCPWHTEANEQIASYYDRGFDITNFPKIRHPVSGNATSVKFWASVWKRASELFCVNKRALTPGAHFAITEVVHCKSVSELGVKEALETCVNLHLESVMARSGAVVVCSLGTWAQRGLGLIHVQTATGMPLVLNLPHPNFRGLRKCTDILNDDQLQNARNLLARFVAADA